MNDATTTNARPYRVDYRQARGAVLAKTKARAIRLVAGDVYLVPSATGSGGSGYVVDVAACSCSCPDWELNRQPCKHVFAVRYVRHELEMPDGTSVVTEMLQAINKKRTYPRDWAAYNDGACHERERVQALARTLCDKIESPRQSVGRPSEPLGDAVFRAIMKVYLNNGSRPAMSDFAERAKHGVADVERVSSFNSTLRTIGRADLAPVFRGLVTETAKPLAGIEKSFATDSSGLGTSTFSRWFDHKYGEDKAIQRWIKVHATVGTVTKVVAVAEVTQSTEADSPFFKPLVRSLKEAGFDPKEISADKAYLAHTNLAVVEEIGATPFIPFKVNSRSTGSDAWERMWHHAHAYPDEWLRCYHKRSSVESCFGAMKQRFGGSLRSKLLRAQLNEALLKVVCWNLHVLAFAISTLKIDPRFGLPAAMPALVGSTEDADESLVQVLDPEIGTEFPLETSS
jgi:transposase